MKTRGLIPSIRVKIDDDHVEKTNLKPPSPPPKTMQRMNIFQCMILLFLMFVSCVLFNLNRQINETLDGLNDAIRTFSAEDITIVFQFPKPFRADDLPER